MLVANVLDLDAVAKLMHESAEKNHWPPKRSEAFMAHFKVELLDLEETGDLASKAQVKSVVLYHLGTRSEGVEPAALVSGVKKYFSGPVFAGADLDRYCLSGQVEKDTSARMLSSCP